MPCHVDPPTASEKSSAREASLEWANFYMHSADMLREAMLKDEPDKAQIKRHLDSTWAREMHLPYISPYGDSQALREQRDEQYKEYERAVKAAQQMLAGKRWARKQLERDQIRHREVDVKRLIKTFADQGQYDKIEPLLKVDFTKPLEPQIGYDPDDY